MSSENISPTRINLIQTKKTLNLAESGREVLERKRDVLLRELRSSIYDAEKAREELLEELIKAYQSLVEAIMAKGSSAISNIALTTNRQAEYFVDYRSIMGVTVPLVTFEGHNDLKPDYGFANTSAELDRAFKYFYKVVQLLAHLAKAEGTTFQIANDVRKTQRRVNALNHVLIPRYRDTANWIQLVLEEKDREEFVRTKKIKSMIKGRSKREMEKFEQV
jgi:V/A-type H+-transporting ATPase subunit D